ncbi:MAG: homing endonuclease associated repeat-containing protein [Gaiellaceae bacterium]
MTRGIARRELATFRAGLLRRYSDDQILVELQVCARRLGRSPTMREFAADPRTHVHPQTVVGHFGTWNRAKRLAGLTARRFATRDELLGQLRALGEELGRTPTGSDLDERGATMPSRSLYWHAFGSFTNALRAAGFEVPRGAERLERALRQGERLATRLGRLPRLADWARAHDRDPRFLSEWQVYRLFSGGRGGWPAFQYLLRERLTRNGVDVRPDGRITR